MKSTGIYLAITTLLTGILFVPTFISESLLFPFITGKNFLFRSLILVAALIFAYIVYTRKKIISLQTPVHFAFLSFIGILLIADLQGVNPIRSLFSNFERMEGWFTHLLLFVFFVLLTQTITTLKTWVQVVQVSLVANIYVILFAFSQYFGKTKIFQSVDRIDGTLGNATYLAGYTMIYVFLLTWLIYVSKSTLARFLYGILALLNIIIIFISLTRGGIVGLTIGAIVTGLLIVLFEKKYISVKRYVLGAIGLVVVGMGLIVLNKNSDFVKTTPVLNRIASVSSIKSLDSRLDVWSISYDGLKENPILGWGQDNFLYAFAKHFSPSMGEREPWFDRSHNVFFDWLIAGGIFGLLAYLSLFIAPLYLMWFAKKVKENFSVIEKSLWTGLLIGYFVFNFFVFDNIVSYILFVFVLGYITWKGYFSENITEIKLGRYATPLAIFLAVFAIIGFFYLVLKPWNTARTLIQGMQYSDAALTAPTDAQAQTWSKQVIGTSYSKAELLTFARGKFEQAAQYPLGRTETREQLVQRLISIVGNQSVSNEEKNAWAQFTLDQLKDELERDPINPRTYQLMGSLFLQFGKPKDAIVFLDKAQELSPKKQVIMFDRAVAYQVSGDYQKGLEISREAYELYPTFLTARARYIFALYRAGKDTEAQAMEPEFLKDALAQSYDLVTNKAYYDQVIAAKVDYRAREAVAAYSKGDMRTYVVFFNQIKELSPEAAERLKQIINANK